MDTTIHEVLDLLYKGIRQAFNREDKVAVFMRASSMARHLSIYKQADIKEKFTRIGLLRMISHIKNSAAAICPKVKEGSQPLGIHTSIAHGAQAWLHNVKVHQGILKCCQTSTEQAVAIKAMYMLHSFYEDKKHKNKSKEGLAKYVTASAKRMLMEDRPRAQQNAGVTPKDVDKEGHSLADLAPQPTKKVRTNTKRVQAPKKQEPTKPEQSVVQGGVRDIMDMPLKEVVGRARRAINLAASQEEYDKLKKSHDSQEVKIATLSESLTRLTQRLETWQSMPASELLTRASAKLAEEQKSK